MTSKWQFYVKTFTSSHFHVLPQIYISGNASITSFYAKLKWLIVENLKQIYDWKSSRQKGNIEIVISS